MHQHNKKDLRVVFIFKNFAAVKNSKVSHIGLGVAGTNTAKTLIENGIQAEVWPVTQPDDLFELLTKAEQDPKPVTHVIISAPWIPTAKLADLAVKYPKIQFTVVCHSNVGFLMADTNGVKLLRQELELQKLVDNFQVAGNNANFTKWASTVYQTEVVFLPNLYNLEGMKNPNKRHYWKPGHLLKIGCFGAVRPLKNAISATAAALQIAVLLDVDTEIWFSSGRNEGAVGIMSAIEQLVANHPKIKIRHNDWQAWPGFRDTVGKMHLLMQPSYTESFNMVTADGIYEGVPSVVSDVIDWVPKNWVGKADDVNDLARVGMELLTMPRQEAKAGQKAIKKYVANGVKAWESFLCKPIESWHDKLVSYLKGEDDDEDC